MTVDTDKVLAINAAIFIVYGRVKRRLPVAVFGFVLLAVAALLVLLGWAKA